MSVIRREIAARLRRALRASERWWARVPYLLDRSRRCAPPVLAGDQDARYQRDGCLLVPGLLAPDVVSAACAAMWRALDARGTANGSRNAPLLLFAPALLACYTPPFLATAARLSGTPPSSFLRPGRVLTVNRFPDAGPWKAHDPHIDHAHPDARHRTQPPPFRIATLTYLTDVDPHGGGTMVWPGSHRIVRATLESRPRRYALVAALNAALPGLPLGAPLELTPRAGDVLFYHPFCVHASSANVRERPRFVLAKKW